MLGGSSPKLGFARQESSRRGQGMAALSDPDPHAPEIALEEDYGKCVHELFVAQALMSPSATAVVDEKEELTYGRLHRLSDELGAHLRRQYGCIPEEVSGIFMERCAAYVVAYLSILKSGAAFCPIELAYPASLLEQVFRDVTPRVTLTKASYVARMPSEQTHFCMDPGWPKTLPGDLDLAILQAEPQADADSLSYVIYSGGSTGVPKGIEACHRSPVASYLWRMSISGYGPGARVGCNVFFVWECLRPLLRGGAAIVIPDDVIFDPPAVVDFLRRHDVTEVLFTPSLLETVLNTAGSQAGELASSLPKLQVIWFNGEVVTVKLLEQARRTLPRAVLLNTYSISECGEVAAINLREHRADLCPKFCTVGRPVAFGRACVMDDAGKEVAFGSTGELWISGAGVGRGYRGRPELTKERFLSCLPGQPDSGPAYRTGDLARFLEDGTLEILGRCDFMAKVRGYSVVLGAVEAAIMKLIAVDACVVLASGAEGTDKRLVAYMVGPSKHPEGRYADWSVDEHGRCPDLYRKMLHELPHYAVPTTYVLLGALPLNDSSGKCDRKKLPAPPPAPPVATLPDGFCIKPTSCKREDLVAQVILIMETVLGVSHGSVGSEDSFFELGGHSLLAARLLSKVRDCTEGKPVLAMPRFLKHPSVEGLSGILLGEELDRPRSRSGAIDESALPAVFLPAQVKSFADSCVNPSGINMQLRAYWRYIVYTHLSSRVLLTGSTGFLGAFLLRELLLHSESQVFCLVRAGNSSGPGACRERVMKNMESYGIGGGEPPSATSAAAGAQSEHAGSDARLAFERLLISRVHFIEGDVSLPKLGLAEEEYHYLALNMDVVVHAAAQVNLILPYEALVGPNVRGTAHVLEFAQSAKVKALHYVSTDGVFPEVPSDPDNGKPWGSFEEGAVPPARALESGYGQSKWVAERLVAQAQAAGLPCAIYRLGNLSGPISGGPHRDGVWNPLDATLYFWAACLQLLAVPEPEDGAALLFEMTPVDFVARFLVESLKDVEFCNGKTFHLINSQSAPASDFAAAAGQCLGTAPLRKLPLQEWLSRHEKDAAAHPERLQMQFDEETLRTLLASHHEYGRENVEGALARFKEKGNDIGSYPEVGRSRLAAYLGPLLACGVLPTPDAALTAGLSLPVRGRLTGRVAMVTGASSGIGKGVACALAAEGATVVLCARRVELLEKLRNDIVAGGGPGGGPGRAHPCPMDVTKRADVASAVAQAEAEVGPISVLVNCAGVMYFTLMKNQHFDEWEQMIDVNCKGVVNCCGAVFAGMVKRKHGHVVNISSDAARTVFPALTVYNAAKAFVNVFSKGLRAESVGTGCRVTDIQPGDVATDLLMQNSDKEAADKVGVKIGEKIGKGAERSSVLDPEDIASAVLYALTAPKHVGVHEILIEPRDQMFGDPTAMGD